MKKTIKRIAIIIVLIISIPILILKMPIERVKMQIDTTKGLKQELIEGQTTQIYVREFPESPGWYLYGKDGVIFEFDKGDKVDKLFITGNFPHKINYTLISNTFVLNGKYIGRKKRKGVMAGCFYVESWGVLGKLRRDIGFENYSKSSITVIDNVFADPIPVFDLEELEDVEIEN